MTPLAKPVTRPEDRRRNLPMELLAEAKNWGKLVVRDDRIPLRLEFSDERHGFEILVALRLLEDNTVVIDKITIGDNRPTKDRNPADATEWAKMLERLPLTSYIRAALNQWPQQAVQHDNGLDAHREAVQAASHKIGDPIELTARLYSAYQGHDPVKAVARQLDIPANTAKSRIRAARKRGLLPPGDPRDGRRPDSPKDQP